VCSSDLVTVYETHPADSRVKEMGEVCQTVTSRWGTGGGNVPIATAYNITFCDANGTRKDRPNGGMYVNETDTSNTLTMAGVGTNAVQNMRVRRLTPTECERLQGFPDNYTNIFEKTPDSHRYKALGNSMAVPVMRWIGERINAS
jgi:DNA (cytosine-5)-methyltransferase 1